MTTATAPPTTRCTIDHYRGWSRHAAEGCAACEIRLRDYNRTAQRRSRQSRFGERGRYAYPDAVRTGAVAHAAEHGARAAARKFEVSQSRVYEWCRAAGVKPAEVRRAD